MGRKEEARREIEISMQAHGLDLDESSRVVAFEQPCQETRTDRVNNEIMADVQRSRRDRIISAQVRDIFDEDQDRFGSNAPVYQLLDQGFAPRNPLCDRFAIEDDYTESSRP